MNRQVSFFEPEYASKKKVTRRECFFADIGMITRWPLLISEIAPHYPKSGTQGRQPRGIAKILRLYIARQCFGLSDKGIEDASHDSQSIRKLVGIDLSRQSSPDATTLIEQIAWLKVAELLPSPVGPRTGRVAAPETSVLPQCA